MNRPAIEWAIEAILNAIDDEGYTKDPKLVRQQIVAKGHINILKRFKQSHEQQIHIDRSDVPDGLLGCIGTVEYIVSERSVDDKYKQPLNKVIEIATIAAKKKEGMIK